VAYVLLAMGLLGRGVFSAKMGSVFVENLIPKLFGLEMYTIMGKTGCLLGG
jgi:hypothetical protein